VLTKFDPKAFLEKRGSGVSDRPLSSELHIEIRDPTILLSAATTNQPEHWSEVEKERTARRRPLARPTQRSPRAMYRPSRAVRGQHEVSCRQGAQPSPELPQDPGNCRGNGGGHGAPLRPMVKRELRHGSSLRIVVERGMASGTMA